MNEEFPFRRDISHGFLISHPSAVDFDIYLFFLFLHSELVRRRRLFFHSSSHYIRLFIIIIHSFRLPFYVSDVHDLTLAFWIINLGIVVQ